MPVQGPNFQEAREFFEALTGEKDPPITFQVFDDKTENFELAGWVHGRLSDERIRKYLIHKASEGCGVFFTLNECDGHGRRAENVESFRCSGVDFDGAALPDPNPFHLTVESSPGKYHGYFRLKPGTDIALWSNTQARLAAYYGGDPRVFDAPRVFRVPGFYHQKSTPFRTKLLKVVNEPPLDINQVVFDHPAEYKRPGTRSQNGNKGAGWSDEDNERDVADARRILARTKPKPGDRNNTAYRLAAALNDRAITRETAGELLHEWAEHLDDPLPPGEVDHVLGSAPTYKASPAGSRASVDAADEFNDVDVDAIKIGGTPAPEDTPEGRKKKRSAMRGIKVAELLALPSPKWLIQNLFVEGGLFEIYGRFKSGKTFWGVEISCCIATGYPFDGEKVKQGKVIYIIAEGSRKLFAYRMEKWARARATPEMSYMQLMKLLDENMLIVPMAVYINNAEQLAAFLQINAPEGDRALVVIDTLFRTFEGNVAEAEAFSRYVAGCDIIRRKYKCAVLFLHHQKRNDAQGGFGSVVAEASVDAACVVEAKDDMRTILTPAIMRDGEVPDCFNAKIKVVAIPEMGEDEIATVGVLEFQKRGIDRGDTLQIIYDVAPSSVADLVVAYNDANPDNPLKERAMFKRVAKLRADGLLSKDGFEVTTKGMAHVHIDPSREFE